MLQSCFKVELFQYSDGSAIHVDEKEYVYIQSSQSEFMKGGNKTVTQLLNLPDIRDVSANVDVLNDFTDLLI